MNASTDFASQTPAPRTNRLSECVVAGTRRARLNHDAIETVDAIVATAAGTCGGPDFE